MIAMATEILKSFNHLQSELEEAKSSLKGVDENIKRLIGRDPSELPPRPDLKRPLDDKNARQPFAKFSRGFENDDTLKRRNPNAVSVFKRLSEKVPEDVVKPPSKGLISKIIAAPKEVPSRQAVLDKQNKDEKFKARNRRMFGALLGTLQRFQQEECKLKKKEEKRTQIEKKIEEHEQQVKEEIKKERHELFLNRKKKRQEIKMIELKMLRMKEYAAWEQSQSPRGSFIMTKAKPHIHYLPRRMDDKSKELLEKSKKEVEEQIEKRRQSVFDELSHIEERMKRKFETKSLIEDKEKSTDRHDRRGSDSDDHDDDVDIKVKSPSPELQEVNVRKDVEYNEAPQEISIEKKEECDKACQEVNVESKECNEVAGNEQELKTNYSNEFDTQECHNESTITQPGNHLKNIKDVYDNVDSTLTMETSSVHLGGAEIYSLTSEMSNVNVIVANNENSDQENI